MLSVFLLDSKAEMADARPAIHEEGEESARVDGNTWQPGDSSVHALRYTFGYLYVDSVTVEPSS